MRASSEVWPRFSLTGPKTVRNCSGVSCPSRKTSKSGLVSFCSLKNILKTSEARFATLNGMPKLFASWTRSEGGRGGGGGGVSISRSSSKVTCCLVDFRLNCFELLRLTKLGRATLAFEETRDIGLSGLEPKLARLGLAARDPRLDVVAARLRPGRCTSGSVLVPPDFFFSSGKLIWRPSRSRVVFSDPFRSAAAEPAGGLLESMALNSSSGLARSATKLGTSQTSPSLGVSPSLLSAVGDLRTSLQICCFSWASAATSSNNSSNEHCALTRKRARSSASGACTNATPEGCCAGMVSAGLSGSCCECLSIAGPPDFVRRRGPAL
mmetsp:Transcript_98928/g.262741  ORF Transcript_98928/g.262741 Transcript_98928/m.262741 type:complete len:324 (-) Transcript_98928:723-1694(-)